jgi:putative ABC transport system ATP-binding protein
MIGDPALLLADEPTGNLDGATGRAVIDCLFEEQARLGSALLLITHEANLAERCDRRLHLADGRIVAEERNSASRPLPLRPPERRGSG